MIRKTILIKTNKQIQLDYHKTHCSLHYSINLRKQIMFTLIILYMYKFKTLNASYTYSRADILCDNAASTENILKSAPCVSL
jgi:hypothetical protein